MLIGKRIKDLRIEKGMSQQDLGDLVGVTKVSICGYENGTRTPSLETFDLLADIFGTTTDYLLGREVPVVSEETNEFVGTISKDDIEIIQELRHYPNLYGKLVKDVKRYVNLINKKMR
jgi:transcriptional regulator with XRE-family HTH domain